MGTENSNEEAAFNNYRERCDRCNAQAQKRVIKDSHDLYMCNHHYNFHEETLVKSGWNLEVISAAPVEKSIMVPA